MFLHVRTKGRPDSDGPQQACAAIHDHLVVVAAPPTSWWGPRGSAFRICHNARDAECRHAFHRFCPARCLAPIVRLGSCGRCDIGSPIAGSTPGRVAEGSEHGFSRRRLQNGRCRTRLCASLVATAIRPRGPQQMGKSQLPTHHSHDLGVLFRGDRVTCPRVWSMCRFGNSAEIGRSSPKSFRSGAWGQAPTRKPRPRH